MGVARSSISLSRPEESVLAAKPFLEECFLVAEKAKYQVGTSTRPSETSMRLSLLALFLYRSLGEAIPNPKIYRPHMWVGLDPSSFTSASEIELPFSLSLMRKYATDPCAE